MVMAGLLAVAIRRSDHPRVLWNASASVPVGLYGVAPRAPSKGELAVFRLPAAARALAVERGYLGAGALVIKPVEAVSGDAVCRYGQTVTVNGRLMAQAHDADAAGRALPSWNGCVVLAAGQVLVLSMAPNSFDSRYFGVVDGGNVVGTGRAIWISP